MTQVWLDGEDISGYVHSFTFAPVAPLPERYMVAFDREMHVETTLIWPPGSGRQIARMFGVPPWVMGIGKRPRRLRSSGQRGTTHHRRHRR